MTTSKDIQQALSVLSSIGNNYSPDQKSYDFSGYGDKYKVSYADILKQHPVNYSFTPSPSSKKKKKSSGINLWDVLSGTLGQPSGIMTNTVYNALKQGKDFAKSDEPLWKKILDLSPNMMIGKTVSQGLKNGAKEQWKDWTDGKLSWGDAGAGFLHGMDKGWKRGDNIMHDIAGVNNRWGRVGGGIGIDIALDPLTYLTGGLSAASKLGKAAELSKISELQKTIGLTGKFKKGDDFIEAATDAMKSSMQRKYPNISERAIDKTVAKKVGELADQIKTARNTTYNAHVNDWGFAVPFTNKFAKVGTYGSKNLLHNSEAMVNPSLVKDLIKHVSKGNNVHANQLEELVKARYGVDSVDQISKTQFDDLDEMLKPFTNNKMPNTNPNKEFYKNISDASKTKYNDMGNFKTNFEHWLDKKNIFDARTLSTGDKFVNSMGDHIADAHSQQIGERAAYGKSMAQVQKFINTLPEHAREQTMKEAIYVLENKAPDALGGDKWVPSDEAKKLADLIRPVVDRIGQQETSGGVLDGLMKNYFPHVINHEEGSMQKIQDFMERNPSLNGKSSKSAHNKERTSFQTIAERDNYISKLEKAIQKETDPDTIESLRRQQERVSKMFDTDVVSALQRRIKTGVRAKAMKDMQGKLSKYGMMKTITKDSKEAPPSGLQELSKDEASKLGLGEGRHYIHPDVLKGMKRVDEIFTAEGMNKLVRHISAIADIWRPLVTYYKPSHYMNNMLGNMINNLAAGVKVSDYRASIKLLKGYRDGTLTSSQMKVMESAFKHNVLSGGYLHDSHQTFNFADPSTLEKIAQKVGNNKAIKKARYFAGEKMDDFSRLANYVNGVNKFGNTERAAKQVRTYLFNYNELTNADRTMRVAVPFWNWTKRNVPLQMKLLMENPKFAMNIERFKNLFNDGEDGADWQKETGIHLPFKVKTKNKDGEMVNTDYYTSVPSPTQDLSMLLNPREFLGSMTPAAKIPLETMMNKKMYSGKPISYGSDNVQAGDFAQYLLSNLGLGGNAYDAFSGKRGAGESIINLFKNVSKVQQ